MDILSKVTVLFEDENYAALSKPVGLVVHSDGKTVEPLLTDWVLLKYPETKGVGEPIVTTEGKTIERPGIVHRLDRGTSGVILIAKNQDAHAALKLQFQEHTIKKIYHAFVYGELKEEFDIINKPIGRSASDFRKWSATRGARGDLRPAETWYTTLAARGGFSFVEVEPKTGRTHQIRVHFKALNHPIVCDRLYASEKECALGFGRTALHASKIEFTDMKGKRIVVKAPFPDDFKEAFIELGIKAPKI